MNISELESDVNSFIRQMRDDTADGRDTDAINRWAERVASGLSNTEDPSIPMPDMRPRGIGIGGHFGIGGERVIRDFSECISAQSSIAFGIDVMFDYRPQSWKDAGKKRDVMTCFRQEAGISVDYKVINYLQKANPLYDADKRDRMAEFIVSPRLYVAHS